MYVFAYLENSDDWKFAVSKSGTFLWVKEEIERYLANPLHLPLHQLLVAKVVKANGKYFHSGKYVLINTEETRWWIISSEWEGTVIRSEIERLKRLGTKFILAKIVHFRVKIALKD